MKKQGKIILTLGVLLMASALVYSLMLIRTDNQAGEASRAALNEISAAMHGAEVELADENVPLAALPDGETVELPDEETPLAAVPLNPNREMTVVEVKGKNYIGVLEIPDLGLELPVADEWDEAVAKTAPCRYSGTAYKGGFVIAAHNYKSLFGSIKRLEEGARITFTDMDGLELTYEVAKKEVLDATAIDEMVCADWDLTLFTCNFDGSARYTVRCSAADQDSTSTS